MRRWRSIEDEGPSGGGGPERSFPRLTVPISRRPYSFRSQHPMRGDQYAPENRPMYSSGPSLRYWTTKKQNDSIRLLNEMNESGVIDLLTSQRIANVLSRHYGPLFRTYRTVDTDRNALWNILGVNMQLGSVLFDIRRDQRPAVGRPPLYDFDVSEDIWTDIREYSVPLQKIEYFVKEMLRMKKDLEECIATIDLM